MALTFPSSPTNGQIYADTVTGNRYIFDSAKSIWKFAANNVGMSVSSTPPSNVAPGSMWFNREIGRTFVYYDDGDSKQWIETVPATGSFDSTTVASYANAAAVLAVGTAYNAANAGFSVANTALQNSDVTLSGSLISTGGMYAQGKISGGIGNGLANGVYIGTQSTYGTIEIVGQTGGLIDFSKTGADYFGRIIYDNASNTMSISATSNVIFNIAGSERMRIDPTGNVGIGTTLPSYKLDVTGTVNAASLLVNGSAAVTSTTSPWVLVGSTTVTNGAAIQNTTLLTSSYGRYMIVMRDVFSITNATTLFMQFYSGGAYQGASYGAASTVLQTGGYTNMTTSTGIYLTYPSQSSSAHAYYGIIHLLNPANATYYKPYFGQGTMFNGTNQMNTYHYGGAWMGGTGAITGFQVYAGSGNITGTVQVYGAV